MQRRPSYSSTRFESSRSKVLLLGLVFGTLACHDHGDDHHGGGGHIGPDVFDEREPNGSAWNADWIGGFDRDSHILIRGSIDDGGPDLYDGFAFVARESCTVDFSLYGFVHGSDLDIAVYDPFYDEFVEFWETPYNPEEGAFVVLDAGQEFHLVINSFQYDTDYDLELWGSPPIYGPTGGDGSDTGSIRPRDAATHALARGQAAQRMQAYRKGSDSGLRESVDEQPVLLFEYDPSGDLIGVTEGVLRAEEPLRARRED